MATHIYTSIAANYLPKARVLAHSIKKFHPDFRFHLVLCDKAPGWFCLENEPFDSLITLNDLKLENPEQWIFKHTLVELSTGVKGFALEKLLAIPGCTEVLYFDPDIVVLSPLDRLLAEFAQASILLTPHLAEPETTVSAIFDNEVCALQHGIYNLGFIGVKNSAEGRRFAEWWSRRLDYFCYDDIPHGMFTDQRWADFVPAYFPDHKLLRDPAYNVCTWNLTNRTVTGSLAEGLLVNGQPLVFYHFSGFDSGAQHAMLDKYGKSMPALYELREWYLAECDLLGQPEIARIPWAYGFFDNGERILNVHRRRYRERADLQSAFPNPYLTRDVNCSYLHWFRLNDDGQPEPLNALTPNESPATPEYRVFVVAAAEDAPFVQQTLQRILERTVRREDLYFAANQRILAETRVPPGIQSIPLQSEWYDDLFAELLNKFGDKDALLIRAGALPPDKWDLRLAWGAVRQTGIATVSPVDERVLDPSGAYRSADRDDLLDRLCYRYRPASDVETASFSRDCVYVRAEAIHEISLVEKNLHPAGLLDGAGRLRYLHFLAAHVAMAWHRPRTGGPAISLDSSTSATILRLRDRIRSHFHSNNGRPPAVVRSMTGANLHIMHSWGGGLERWVADYCRADREHNNFVLKSMGEWGAFGRRLQLYRDISDSEPLEVWPLEPHIKATVSEHPAYQEVLSNIVQKHGVRRIIVSSLIGHSMDALRQPRATVFVCHEYYPFCPALNITFGEVCQGCDALRLTACTQDNPHNRFFPNVPPAEWLHLRKEFAAAIRDHAVPLIAPSPSVRDNYARLAPELAPFFRVIPHGTAPIHSVSYDPPRRQDAPLRVLILGSLALNKGGLLLDCVLPDLLRFCEVMLVGCGEYGKPYAENPKITVISQYDRDKLAELIADLKPDLGLLLSVVPETFSYTLQELQDLKVPVLATGIGSFLDRIQDGVTGLLCAPEPAALVERLKELAGNRCVLREIHENLKTLPRRSVEEMLRDYEALHPVHYSPRSYFDTSNSPQPLPDNRLQLFWRTATRDFREAESVVREPLGRARQLLRLPFLPSAEPVTEVRLDLSSQPGFFLLHGLALRDHQDRAIWTWDGNSGSLESILCNQIVFLSSRTSDTPALLYFTGADPFLILPIEAALLACLKIGSYIEIDFALSSAEEQINAVISSVANGHRDPRYAETVLQFRDRKTEDLEAEVRDRELRVRELESLVAAVRSSMSWRLTRPARALAAVGRKLKGAVAHSSNQSG